MEHTVKLLLENRRLDEAKKKEALNSLANELKTRLSRVEGYSHHSLSIVPNPEKGCVDIEFKGTKDRFSVYPQRTKISNENSNKVVKVQDIDGAYIEGTKVYDHDGNLIGDALIRMRAIHNKSDYSTNLDDASYQFNSSISDIRRLEKYIAKDAINKMK